MTGEVQRKISLMFHIRGNGVFYRVKSVSIYAKKTVDRNLAIPADSEISIL